MDRSLSQCVLLIAICLHWQFTVSSAFATAQFPDKIIHEGEEHMLHTNPLEAYFQAHPRSRPNVRFTSSALWRGYVATFEIVDGMLLLRDVGSDGYVEELDARGGILRTRLRGHLDLDAGPLVLDCFTGWLIIPHGKLVEYVHMGYGSTYSDYILLRIEEGRLTGRTELDHEGFRQFRTAQYQAFMRTGEYREFAEWLRERGRSDEHITYLVSNFENYASRIFEEDVSPAGYTEDDRDQLPQPACTP